MYILRFITVLFPYLPAHAIALAPASNEQQVIKNPDQDVEIHCDSPLLSNPPTTSKNTTLLTFDEIPVPPSSTLMNLTHYNSFNISGFRLTDTRLFSDNESALLGPHEKNCATSFPNTLIGSRSMWEESPGVWPRVVYAPNETSNYQYFKLRGFSAKAIGYVPQYTTVNIQAYEIKKDGTPGNAPGLFAVYLREGWQQTSRLDLRRWASWDMRISMFEIYGRTPGKEDVGICVDDLEVEFV